MNMTIFSIWDSKAEAFHLPWFTQNVQTGLRMFSDAVNDSGTQFNKHAGDYTLFEMGTFETTSGKFKQHKTPINHGLAITFILEGN